ncbi:MAG: hypothetical protein GX358_07880 [candidate division WS1 bacterium]|nr:hypothetical protein [candidate division WS1 bacterium]
MLRLDVWLLLTRTPQARETMLAPQSEHLHACISPPAGHVRIGPVPQA